MRKLTQYNFFFTRFVQPFLMVVWCLVSICELSCIWQLLAYGAKSLSYDFCIPKNPWDGLAMTLVSRWVKQSVKIMLVCESSINTFYSKKLSNWVDLLEILRFSAISDVNSRTFRWAHVLHWIHMLLEFILVFVFSFNGSVLVIFHLKYIPRVW